MSDQIISIEEQADDWVPFWFGIAVDHIIETCPIRASSFRDLAAHGHWRQGVDLVDPHGTDICGWCRRVWLARNAARGDA